MGVWGGAIPRAVVAVAAAVLLATASFAQDASPDAELLVGLEDVGEHWVDELPDPEKNDPWEGTNRQVFRFNEVFMGSVVEPVGSGAGRILPEGLRRAFGNFFSNLSQPVVFVNDLLQLSPRRAFASGGRFLFNSTFGMLGLFDAAERVGIPDHESDFGQTLGVYGVPSGPYLILPFLGPSTVRDGFGTFVDFLFRPDLWLLGIGPALAFFGGDVWFTFDMERGRLAALRATSVDFYAALRGAYLMDRGAGVELRRRELARDPERER